jgi:hypothetical protein
MYVYCPLQKEFELERLHRQAMRPALLRARGRERKGPLRARQPLCTRATVRPPRCRWVGLRATAG